MQIGYSRISTDKQTLNSQLDELKKAGCEKIFTDTISGSKKERAGLTEMLEYARAGDCVVVYRLDRLGRSLPDLLSLMTQFEEQKLGFKSLTENIDTTTAIGKLVFQISGAFAEFERNIIRQRTKIGLDSARARGRLGGRPTKITPDKIRMAKQLHKDKNNKIEDILKVLGVSRRVFYKMLKIESNCDNKSSSKNLKNPRITKFN